jgi:hypothetical protein
MWLPNDVIDAVDRVARIHYVDRRFCNSWNEHRKEGELRLLTGWAWTSKTDRHAHRQGFKTMTVCYRDAYYSLVRKEIAPAMRPLRVVGGRRVA